MGIVGKCGEMLDKREVILKESSMVLHPVRWRIISTLEKSARPMYIGEIADAVGIDRRLVSFHLSSMEEIGFLESKFDVIEKASSLGKAGRFYSLTPKVKEIKEELSKLLEE